MTLAPATTLRGDMVAGWCPEEVAFHEFGATARAIGDHNRRNRAHLTVVK